MNDINWNINLKIINIYIKKISIKKNNSLGAIYIYINKEKTKTNEGKKWVYSV